MANLNSFAFIYVLIIFSLLFCGIVVQDTDADYLTDIKTEGNYERDTLPDNKFSKAWVDPYEMSFAARENEEELIMTPSQIPDMASYPPILDDDDQPYFSNVRGEVIERIHTPYERSTSNDFKTEGFLPKGRQQICVLDSIYISRWLKELVFKIENESELEPSAVSFQLDSIMLHNLKELSTAKSLEIGQLDNLICNMISQTVVTRKEVHDWTIFRGYCIDIAWVIVYVTSLCFLAYVFHCSFKRHPKLMLLFCGVAIGVFWHWMNLYQRIKTYKHAELTSMNIPDECKKHDFELFEYIQDYIKSYFIKNECDTYYETLPVDPLWETSFVVAASEVINVFLFHPISTSSQVNCAIQKMFDDLSVNVFIFLVMFVFLLIVMVRSYGQLHKSCLSEPHSTFRNYVENVFANATGLLQNRVCKASSGIQRSRLKETVGHDSDGYVGPDSLDSQERNSNHNHFPSIGNDTSPRSRNVPENFCSSGFCCESCHPFEQSLSEDDEDDSDTYSDDTSGSDNSDSQDCCPCCVANQELLQELHVGCRDCENNRGANGGAGSSRDIPESVSKRSETTVSADEHDSQNANFIDESMPTRQRISEHGSNLNRGGSTHANGSEGSPRHKVDPLAG